MRGEHMADAYKGLHIRGSSPYTRGARKQLDSVSIAPGIIPACAGSTHSRLVFNVSSGNHPRMRGEHATFSSASALSAGSSPHARGAPVGPRPTR